MQQFKAVVFDLDGLLLDTERVALETGVEALASIGHPLTQAELQRVVGLDAEAGHRLICEMLDHDLPFADIYGPWDAAFLAGTEDGIPLRPRVLDVLDLLDKLGMPRAVATNSELETAKWKIERAGIGGRFDAIVGRDSAGGSKPQPHVYLHAAKLLGIDPADCLALEDSDVGVRAAKAAGMTVVQIPDMVPSSDRAANHQADDLMAALEWAGIARS
ncbi:MAG: hypothetical protein DI498_09080 [Paracoccus denitrificans]|nr:MAG: hypothetical protein DI498_09080 [Paracoccus denitrificans]PZO84032.1 MAG: hypothetical protein DI633_09080 [Paracoccus denitrificans]